MTTAKIYLDSKTSMKTKPDYAAGCFHAHSDIHNAIQKIAEERVWSVSQTVRILLTEKLTEMGLLKRPSDAEGEE